MGIKRSNKETTKDKILYGWKIFQFQHCIVQADNVRYTFRMKGEQTITSHQSQVTKLPIVNRRRRVMIKMTDRKGGGGRMSAMPVATSRLSKKKGGSGLTLPSKQG